MSAATLTLTDFLLARIAEDEAVALAASNPPWIALTFYPNRSQVTNETEIDGGVIVSTPSKDDSDAEHIARHDPARVLAECGAKRQIVEEARNYSPELSAGDNGEWAFDAVLRLLALPYADHPDYDESWRL